MILSTLLFSDWISLAGLAFSVLSITWIGVFQYGKLIHELKSVRTDLHKLEVKVDVGFEKFERRFEKMDERFEKMDERFEKRFEQLDNKIEKLRDRIDKHIESHDH